MLRKFTSVSMILGIFVFAVFFSPLFKDIVFATDYFFDGFDVRDDLVWEIDENGGLVDYAGGFLTLSSDERAFPVLKSKIDKVFMDGVDSIFEAKFKYSSTSIYRMGDGISIGFTGSTDYPFYQFSFWRDAERGDHFLYNDFNYNCTNLNPYQDLVYREYVPLDFGDSWHVVKIKRFSNDNSYDVFLDDELIYETAANQCVGNVIFLGNPLTGGQHDWNTISYDYVKANDGVVEIDPEEKYVIVPGLGASWNGRAMVYGQEVNDDEWTMTPFVKVYDELVSGFEQNGLVEDSDFFIWNYDWREPVAEIVDSLDTFIGEKVEEGEKVNLVGHSLGGLVARMWAQDNHDDARLGKVMSLGSPHYGVVDAYDAWSGAKFSGRTDAESVFLNLFLTLKRKGGENKLETVRKFAPVLKDLLPVFDFARLRRSVLPYSSMETVNDYLVAKNEEVDLIFDNFKALAVESGQANRWINLRRRRSMDIFFGLWPDGRPMSYEHGQGDGRVLFESAIFDEDEFGVVADSNHGQMVTDGTNQVMDYFGLEQVVVAENDTDLSNKHIFYLGSPAEMKVDCGNGWIDDVDGFVIADKADCEVEILGTADGQYHLVFGEAGGDLQYFESQIDKDELVKLEVNEDGEIISKDFLWDLIEKDLELLLNKYPRNGNLRWAMMAVKRRWFGVLRWRVSMFARRAGEREISDRIIAYSKLLIKNRWGGYDY